MHYLSLIAYPRAWLRFAVVRMRMLLPVVCEFAVIVAAGSLLGAGYAAALAWDWFSELL
ncbi:hypothetical protein [Piscinibacter sp. XHJ-5]|uniref:hypothetical protein n=1 Tax=Piscinibacter sp. XHJ-5 TaxID=3037797 RepID=UPI0024530D7C|nr:hypothetical protein [Piscinibacter sp. XHJ-5]